MSIQERLRDRYGKHSQELRDEAADELDRIEAPYAKNARLYFTTFGALIDFTILGIALIVLSQSE